MTTRFFQIMVGWFKNFADKMFFTKVRTLVLLFFVFPVYALTAQTISQAEFFLILIPVLETERRSWFHHRPIQ